MIWPLAMLLAGAEPAMIVPGERLVMVGTDDPNLDACGGYGVVKPLDPKGANFLSVRIAPGGKAAEKDRIRAGQSVFLCDSDAKGEWVGVVYSLPSDGNIDCGVGTPSAYVGAYRGPCRYGWVNSRYIDMIAG